jgi:hypothetical protein
VSAEAKGLALRKTHENVLDDSDAGTVPVKLFQQTSTYLHDKPIKPVKGGNETVFETCAHDRTVMLPSVDGMMSSNKLPLASKYLRRQRSAHSTQTGK